MIASVGNVFRCNAIASRALRACLFVQVLFGQEPQIKSGPISKVYIIFEFILYEGDASRDSGELCGSAWTV